MQAFKKHGEISQWKIIYVLFLIILAVALMWYYQSAPRAELADKSRVKINAKTDSEFVLDSIISSTGLPTEFIYKGHSWKATSLMWINIGLFAVGSSIGGDDLYCRRGMPADSCMILYLKGNTINYKDVYVKYEPVYRK